LYRICVEGHLGRHWISWFEGLSITHFEDNETQLFGYLADQAALYGVLHKIQNLGIPLIAVCRVPPDDLRR